MLSNTIAVPIGVLVSALINKLLRYIDRGCSDDITKTK